jgi:hypothetical protein
LLCTGLDADVLQVLHGAVHLRHRGLVLIQGSVSAKGSVLAGLVEGVEPVVLPGYCWGPQGRAT